MRVDRRTNKGRKYQSFLCGCLCLTIVFSIILWVWNIWNKVPSNILVRAGVKQGLEFYVPATATIYKNETKGQVNVDLNQQITFYGEAEDTYTMKVDLFGFIPFKKSAVSVIQERKVTPLGYPVGIYVQTDGILVIDTGSFQSSKGKKVSPAKNLLLPGDYIYEVNQKKVESKEELMNIIEECAGQKLVLGVRREDAFYNIEVEAIEDKTGEYKLGIWVRDSAQGIGTLTFADENGYFGALGHGINDVDTTNLMEMKEGGLYKADIISITKGEKGSPGELTGVIAYSNKYKLGGIWQNTQKGVYGILETDEIQLSKQAVSIALKQEIEEGAAQVLCTLSTEPELFDVEITAIHLENDNVNRGLELKVTDERLLETTGGIIQGMFTSYNGSNNRKASKIKGFLMF